MAWQKGLISAKNGANLAFFHKVGKRVLQFGLGGGEPRATFRQQFGSSACVYAELVYVAAVALHGAQYLFELRDGLVVCQLLDGLEFRRFHMMICVVGF